MPYAITHVETLHAGWTKLLRATVRFPDGRLVRREVEDHGTAVGVLPYDPDRRVAMLISQFRTPPLHAAGEVTVLEAPAGLLDEGDPEAGARREALEETGLRLGGLEPVALVWTMPGISTERMHLFLAPYGEGDRVAAGGASRPRTRPSRWSSCRSPTLPGAPTKAVSTTSRRFFLYKRCACADPTFSRLDRCG
jgi:8-oxo-dGTP pyrophosphatase MutT (NUDIX family)